MIGRVIRILIGIVVAYLAAGLTQALFAYTPAHLLGLPWDVASDRFSYALELSLFAAVQGAFFSWPLALVAAGIGEWRRVNGWTYYVLASMAIAVLGFYAQYTSEIPGQPTIVNNYAFAAFLTAGFVAGFMYWIAAGRHADAPAAVNAAKPAAQSSNGSVAADSST